MSKHEISPKALLLGYAMARLDGRAVELLGCRSWKQAYAKVGAALGEKPTSIKGLRDEFDPYFNNSRRGWIDKKPVANRLTLLSEMATVSDAALEAMVLSTLSGVEDVVEAVQEVLATPPSRLHNVGERLQTGHLAEQFFLAQAHEIVGVVAGDLIDMRLAACGYDFGIRKRESVVEVKGLTSTSGQLLFTDLEWRTAALRRSEYLLVVVSEVRQTPKAQLLPDPTRVLAAEMRTQRAIQVTWSARYP